MKVGILSQWFPPESGPASIPGVLAQGLVERGHEVAVVTGLPNYPTGQLYDGYHMRLRHDSTESGYSLRRVALYPDHSPKVRGRLLNYCSFAASASVLGVSALRDVDVLWVYNSPATVALPMWLAKFRFRTPIVLHNMDMWPDSVLHTGFAPRRGQRAVIRGLDAWVNAMYRSAAIVAYLSPAAGNELHRRGVPENRLRYSPLWVDEVVFRPTDASELRCRLGFRQADIVIGYAGALGKAQGIVEMVEAVTQLPTALHIKCLVLGSGTEETAIRNLSQRHPDRVTFIGHIPQARMTEYASVPDISYVGLSEGGQAAFAVPSKIPAIMACAKPILASASGDAAHLVNAAGCGFSVAPGDTEALRRVLRKLASEGRGHLKELGLRGRRYYEDKYSTATGIERIEQALMDAMAVSNPLGERGAAS